MAHWAQLDESNVVIQVIVTDNNDDNYETTLAEERGGVWKKTSYNTKSGEHLLGGVPFRKNYAAIGGIYDPIRDAFIPPMPPSTTRRGTPLSYILNEDTCDWELVVEGS
jgi:hypothetical protein